MLTLKWGWHLPVQLEICGGTSRLGGRPKGSAKDYYYENLFKHKQILTLAEASTFKAFFFSLRQSKLIYI